MRGLRIALLGCVGLGLGLSGASAQELPGGRAIAAPAVSASPSPTGGNKLDTYGTSFLNYQRIGVSEFTPADSSMTWSDIGYSSLAWGRYPTNANGLGSFIATPHLPSGALVYAVEFDYCDTNASSDISFTVQTQDYLGQNDQFAGTATSSGSGGCGFQVATLSTPFEIDNNFNQIVLLAQLPAQDGSLSLSGAIVRYKLQVSPAPGTATFPDVPTSDFGFQYVEALVASGITGGCGGGLYCPDAPVTRRQMAIFIAKALGLHYN